MSKKLFEQQREWENSEKETIDNAALQHLKEEENNVPGLHSWNELQKKIEDDKYLLTNSLFVVFNRIFVKWKQKYALAAEKKKKKKHPF